MSGVRPCAPFSGDSGRQGAEPLRLQVLFMGKRGFTLIELLLAVLVIGVLLAVALPSWLMLQDRKNIAVAEFDITGIATLCTHYYDDNQAYPASLADVGAAGSLDPWGNPYQYHNTATGQGNGLARKDHKLHPLNSDFDLYSMGIDGASVSPLTAKPSRDDIVRANDGAFVGPVADYSPP